MLPDRSCFSIFINCHVDDLGCGHSNGRLWLIGAFGFDLHLNRYGSLAFPQYRSVEAHNVTDVNRRDKFYFVHRSCDEVFGTLSRCGHGAGQVDMAQDNAAKNGSVRVGVTRQHGHAQGRFPSLHSSAPRMTRRDESTSGVLPPRQRYASHNEYFLSLPLMISKNVCWRSVVTGPRQPAPIWRSSTSRMGVNSAAVPVKKASSV